MLYSIINSGLDDSLFYLLTLNGEDKEEEVVSLAVIILPSDVTSTSFNVKFPPVIPEVFKFSIKSPVFASRIKTFGRETTYTR